LNADFSKRAAAHGEGRTVNFRLSGRRDVGAPRAYLQSAIKTRGSVQRTITLDGYAAPHRAVREMKTDSHLPADAKIWSLKYLNAHHAASYVVGWIDRRSARTRRQPYPLNAVPPDVRS
jgi:transposase-like protein